MSRFMLRIPVSTRDSLDNDLSRWLIRWLSKQDLSTDIDIDIHECSAGPAESRNEIVYDHFLPSSSEYLWMIDSDVVPPKNLSLLEYASKGILAGWYRQYKAGSDLTPMPNVFKEHPDKNGTVVYYKQKDWPKDPLVPCDVVGTGCILIHRSVLEAFPLTDTEAFVYGRHSNFNPNGKLPRRLGEDITFCLRSKDKGFSINVLQSYHCKHFRITSLDDVAASILVSAYNRR